jgi:sigma-B regulation protein RsbU (phosphoserine phosphatase)
MRDLPPEKFITMLYAVLDPARSTLTWANAGHPWPIAVKGRKTQVLDGASGLPLGIQEATYDEQVLQLPAGARAVFYSDGVTEAAVDDRSEYGLRRLKRQLMRPELSARRILDDVARFCKGAPLADDATVVVLAAQS